MYDIRGLLSVDLKFARPGKNIGKRRECNLLRNFSGLSEDIVIGPTNNASNKAPSKSVEAVQ
jgi:hypothetical protein